MEFEQKIVTALFMVLLSAGIGIIYNGIRIAKLEGIWHSHNKNSEEKK